MAGGDSTLFTIGTALRHARELDLIVEVLVAGHWLSGTVTALDGYGVVLTSGVVEQSVIRLEMISAVRMGGVARPVPSRVAVADVG